MSSKLSCRIAKIEAQQGGPAAFVVLLPANAYDHGTEHLKRVTAEAIHEHRARTGYQGAVLIGSQECMSVEEWTERYCVRGGDDALL